MWSHDLAEGAQSWADQLASSDSLQHDQATIQNRKIGRKELCDKKNSNISLVLKRELPTEKKLEGKKLSLKENFTAKQPLTMASTCANVHPLTNNLFCVCGGSIAIPIN